MSDLTPQLQQLGMAPATTVAPPPQQQQDPNAYDPTQDPAVTQAPGSSAYGTDLSQLDQKLQTMKQVEQGWGLPPLPDAARLDLATIPNTTHQDLASMLWGLASDLNPLSAQPAAAAGAAQVMPLDTLTNVQFNQALSSFGSVQNPGFTTPQDPSAGINQFRAAIGGLEGQKAPSVVDPNATSALVKRAIGYGILPIDTPTDGSYTPADASVFAQVAYMDLQSRIHGNEPGAVSISTLHHSLTDFLDPKKLTNAAWNAAFHSFIPAQKDLDSSHTAWSDFLDHPTHPGKLLHAFKTTIPVVTPIATDVLLVTGVGEVIGAARAGMVTGDAAVSLADAGEATYKTASAAAKAATEVAQENLVAQRAGATVGERVAGRLGMGDIGLAQGQYDLARTAEPGLISNQLARFGPTQPLSGAMNAWRAWAPAGVTKAAVSNLFRVGTVELAGARLDSGSALSNSVDHFKLGVLDNRYVSDGLNMVAIPLSPPSVFRPGTLTTVFEPAKSLLQSALMISKDSDPARTTFEVVRGLAAKSPEFAAAVKKQGPTQALTEYLGGKGIGDQAAGQFIAHAALHTAIDKDSWNFASRMHPDPLDVVPRKAVWLQRRGQITSQLVHLDENDVESFLDSMGRKAGRQGVGLTKSDVGQLATDLQSSDPGVKNDALDYMNEIVRDHNAKRGGVATSMLAGLKPGDVEAHVRDFFGNEDNWNNYLAAYDDVRHNVLGAGDGVLSIDPQTLEAGRTVRSGLTREPAFAPTGQRLKLGDNPFSNIAAGVLDRTVDPSLIKDSWTMPATKDLVPATHRFALARLDTPTVQDQARLLGQFRLLQRLDRSIQYISSNPDMQGKLAGLFSGLGVEANQLVPQDVLGSAVESGLPGAGDRVRRAAATLNTLNADENVPFRALSQAKGGFTDLPQARAAIKAAIDNLDANTQWSEQWGVPTTLALDDKLKTLKRMMDVTASNVEGVPAEVEDRIRRYGYKLVAGAQFVHPQDLKDLVEPFPTLSKMQMHQLSLGTFFQPQENQALAKLLRSSLHTQLTDVLAKHGLLDKTALPDEAPVAGDVNDIMQRLYGRVYQRQNQALSDLDQARSQGGLIDRLQAQVSNTLVPQGLRDLSPGEIRKALPDYADNKALLNDVQRAILKSHDIGFRYNGLATIEDKLRSYNLLTDGLLLGKTSAGGFLKRLAISGAVGGAFGAAQPIAQGDFDPHDIVRSAAGSAFNIGKYELKREALALAARKGLPLLGFDSNNWARYAYLPDTLAKIRNAFRFTMSPMFDLRRYGKGALVAQMVADHEGATLPLANRIAGLEKDFGAGSMGEARGMWDAATKGEFQNFEDTEREFSQRGILSYTPQEQMAMTNYRLVKQGVDPAKAYAMTQKTYGYGVGRSAAEKSVNFMFFPFSFEKKLMTNSGKFLNDDFARLLMVHDGLKTYDMLNKRYDLSKELQDHVPLLRDIEKLNPFDHGVDLGELGGINAPFMRLFTPVILHASGLSDHKSLQNIATRLVPAFNDIDRLVQDTQSQGHVLFGSSHLTPSAEADAGFTQMNALKLKATTDLKTAGYKDPMADMRANPALASYRQWYDNQKALVMSEYPAYETALAKASAKSTLNQEAMQVDLRRQGPAFDAMRLFDQYEKRYVDTLKTRGFSTSNPEDYPPAAYQDMQKAAVWFYEQTARGQGMGAATTFKSLYQKYYSHAWGPIERPI